jgi:predicted dehydrogenase
MIRAAQIGLGWWGRTILRELAASELIRPVLAIDPDPIARAATSGIAVAEHFEAALTNPGIDAVILTSPHRFHADQIVAAAAAGKHVFCEKPICITGADAERAIAAIEKAGLILGIGHERRHEPAVKELRARLAAGDFGTALVMEGNFNQDKFLALPPDNWRLSATEAPVGPLSATGIHMVDLAIALFGTPHEVWARLATRATSFANGDTLTITLGFKNGATALIGAVLATPFDGRLTLYGSLGWMEIRDREHPESPQGWDVTTRMKGAAPEHRFFPPHPAVRDNLEAFARAIRGEALYPVTHAEMLANAKCFEAITRSALFGGIVTI